MQRGYIYKGVHSGWYAISDEAFYTSSQVEKVEDPNTGSVVHVRELAGSPKHIDEAVEVAIN